MVAPAKRPLERVVLVVDDDEAVRRITALILTEAGFRVLDAHDTQKRWACLLGSAQRSCGW